MSFLGILAGLVLGAIIIALVVGIPIALIYSVWLWTQSLGSEKPWIKFKDFIKLYNASPDKWDIYHDGNPLLRTSPDGQWNKTYVYFKFHYIDYYRYRLWKYNSKRQKQKQRAQKAYVEAMMALQQYDELKIAPDGKDPRIKALVKDIVNYINEGRKEK